MKNNKTLFVLIIMLLFQFLIFAIYCNKMSELASLKEQIKLSDRLLSQSMQFQTDTNSEHIRLFKNQNEALQYIKGLQITKDISCLQITGNNIIGYNTFVLIGETNIKALVNFLADIRKTKAAIRVGSFEFNLLSNNLISYKIILEYLTGK